MTPQKFTWGSSMIFWPPQIFWKEIFSGTHLHVVVQCVS